MNNYKNAQHIRKPSGHILIDGQEVANTMQCCHCGEHFVMIKGSGTIRGHCTLCHSMTCGKPECNPCIPFEKKIEQIEGASLTKIQI